MDGQAAELFAIRALGWIVADQDLAGRFLAASGASVEELRLRAQDAEFLGFFLDFLLADEAALLACAAALGVSPETPMRARMALPGGDAPFYT